MTQDGPDGRGLEEQLRALFDAALTDEPESRVSPLSVLREVRVQEDLSRWRRQRVVRALGAVAAVVVIGSGVVWIAHSADSISNSASPAAAEGTTAAGTSAAAGFSGDGAAAPDAAGSADNGSSAAPSAASTTTSSRASSGYSLTTGGSSAGNGAETESSATASDGSSASASGCPTGTAAEHDAARAAAPAGGRWVIGGGLPASLCRSNTAGFLLVDATTGGTLAVLVQRSPVPPTTPVDSAVPLGLARDAGRQVTVTTVPGRGGDPLSVVQASAIAAAVLAAG